MKIRSTPPTADNKYYLKAPGTPGAADMTPGAPTGYNPCIVGNPINRQYPNSVLANCVGGAVGVFNEMHHDITGVDGCPLLGNRYPSAMLALAKSQGLEVGDEPRPGAACVQYGTREHIFIIGKLRKVGRGIVATIHESGWNFAKGIYLITRESSGANNWGMGSAYPVRGYIYHPDINPYFESPTVSVIKYGTTGDNARWLQWVLVKEKRYEDGYNVPSEIDGHCGERTIAALKKFQTAHGLDPDGYCGPLTQTVIKKLYTIE